jgi:hypothetical protein
MLQVFPKSIAKLFELVPFSKFDFSNGVVFWQFLQFLFYSIIYLPHVHIFVSESLKQILEHVCDGDGEYLQEDNRERWKLGFLFLFFFFSKQDDKKVSTHE